MASSSSSRSKRKGTSGVDYSLVQSKAENPYADRKQRDAARASSSTSNSGSSSATMDAFMRLVTGKEERSISDRINDPSRPTWDTYKKDNADKLSFETKGEQERDEYRKELDAERKKRLRRVGKKDKKSKKRKRRSRHRDDDEKEGRQEKKKKKKKSRHDSSPVRLSSFLHQSSSSSASDDS